jgi:hypothetical protein
MHPHRGDARMRTSEAQRSNGLLTGSRVLALAGITVVLAFLVFSGSAFASVPPAIESESVSHITPTDGTLEAQVNLHEAGAGAYYQFQLVRSPSEYASEILCPQKLPPGTDGCIGAQSASALPIGFIPGNTMQPGVDHSVSLGLASAGVTLQSGTTYHYRLLVARRVQAEDTIQWEPPTVYGANQTFTTPSGPPSIESESVSHLTPTDGTLEAQVNTEGLETTYEFYLQEAPLCLDFGCEVPEREPLALPAGKLLGSFVGQSVSVDLNSAGVTLLPGADYRYWVTASSAAGATRGQTQRFIAPEDGVQPLDTTTPSGTNGNNQGTSSTPTGSGGSPAPGVTPLGPQIVCLCNCGRGCHGKKVGPKHLTQTQKLSKALKACAKKPKSKSTACKKRARKQYGTTGKRDQIAHHAGPGVGSPVARVAAKVLPAHTRAPLT